ncbi:5'-3' exoribonuclease 3-like [Humulus lupulus]|uniref:5'-3' exoribonuclease 3-like n=1 Tax=Humulus lupulus TaxID=3486 RepID=UPI002B407CE0|nr:5'-3' exoribonuclease 3-like [Humulus lupulus]
MAVPAFNRWLVNKFPNVLANVVEAKGENLDTSLPNPNGIEFDNLYLDLNNIIHPCFHPEDDEEELPPPITFEEVFENIFKYIDRVFNIVRPRKLLYMAIDGVAPRAKRKQQRARRFRNAKDKAIAEEEELRVKRQFEMEGKQVLPKQESELSDSNIIIPGTKFMQDLSKALNNYIKSRLSSDLGWRDIKVILSDANVPGEGEHKIMSFIRQQRKLPSYNPNTRHCLYGLDADLIMLALAVHEVHFSLLREDVLVEEQHGHLSYKPFPDTQTKSSSLRCRGRWFPNVSKLEEKDSYSIVRVKHYQFLHVWILREYLELDLQISDPPESFKFDIERIVDDFIFMCFFVGNDFLPRTPSLSIHEGAIDLLMTVYKKEMKNIGDYLVDMLLAEDKKAEFIKLSRVEKFILLVGTFEEKIFKKRSELWERKLKHLCAHAVHDEDYNNSCKAESNNSNNSAIVSLESKSCDYSEMVNNTKELKQTVKDNLSRKSNLFQNGDIVDKVKLGSPGYKERYYREKFFAYNADEIESTRKKLVRDYTEGLIWVLLYYFSETPSWTWFYPYHYGPFVSDFKGISQVKENFVKGVPFKPFDHQLSILPPRSAHVLPVAYQTLMNDDSPIIDLFPNDVEIDVDGNCFTWQGVCKLPLIDESRLLSETVKLVKDLGVEESERNMVKCDQLLVRSTHKVGSHILSVYRQRNEITEGTSLSSYLIIFSVLLSEVIGGSLRLSHKYIVMDNEEVHDSNKDFVLCADYEPPNCGAHIPRLLDGVKLPEKIIREEDLEDTELWHEYCGMKQDKRYNMNIQDRFRKVSINSEYMHNGSGSSGWRSAGRGMARTEYNGSLVMHNRQRSASHDHVVYKSCDTGWGNSKAHNINAIRSSSEKGNFHNDQASSLQTSGSCEKWKKVTTPWATPLTQPNRIGQPRNGNVWQSSQNISRSDVSNNWRHGSWKTSDNRSMKAKEFVNSEHIQVCFVAVSATEWYSALVEDRAMVHCFFEFPDIKFRTRYTKYALVDENACILVKEL